MTRGLFGLRKQVDIRCQREYGEIMLEEILLKRHKSVAQFAEETGLCRSYIYRIMRGQRRGRALTQQKIADALELPVEFLFPNDKRGYRN